MKFRKLSLLLGVFVASISIGTSALAGPVVLIGALIGGAVGVGAVAVGLIAGSMLTAALIGAAVGAAAMFMLGDGLMGNLDTPTYNGSDLSAANAENAGILIDKAGTLEFIPVVYGQRLLSGTRVFVSSNGENNKYLYLAIVLCEGEIEAIDQVLIDDIISTDSRFSGRLEIQKFLGSDTQAASSLLMEAPNWTNRHTLSGIAYLAMRFEWPKATTQEEAEKNPYGGIPRIKALVRGKKVAQPATAGSLNYANESTAYTVDPAAHLLDYLRNPRYGRGLVNNRIDFPSFAVSSTKFASTVKYHSSGVTGPMLTSNAVINTDKTVMANVRTFLANMRSGMPYVQGKFKVKPLDTGNGVDSQNVVPTVSFAIDANHLLDGISIEGTNTKNHYNQVVLTHPNPANDWNMTEITYPIPDSQEDLNLLAEDDGRRLSNSISFQHIIDPSIAADLAHIILYRSRNKKTISFKTTAELHEVEVGDIVTITYDPLGFDAAYFRIYSMKIEPDYTISFMGVEHEPQEYIFKEAQFAYIPPKNLTTTSSGVTNSYLNSVIEAVAPYLGTVIGVPPVVIEYDDPRDLTITFIKNSWDSSGAYNRDEIRLDWIQPTDIYDYQLLNIYLSDSLNQRLNQIDTIRVNATTNTYTTKLPAQESNVYTMGVKYYKINGTSTATIKQKYTTSKIGSLYSASGVVVDGVLINI